MIDIGESEFIKIFKESKEKFALFLGNGINYYLKDNEEEKNESWEEILLKYAKKCNIVNEEITTIPSGISWTEFYDAIELKEDLEIKQELKNDMENWKIKAGTNYEMLNKAKRLSLPVLTLNFDNLIAEYLNLELFKFKGKFTDYYPWKSYYSEKEINNLMKEFAVWHPHGMIKYKRSKRFGLCDYMKSVNRAENFLKSLRPQKSIYENNSKWSGKNTWLEIFFRKNLIFIGIGLKEDEIFIRWLLIEKLKLSKKYNPNQKSYFLTKQGEIEEGQKIFFKSVNIEIVEFKEYNDFHIKIWEKL